MQRIGIIMAGGSGERFWPVSRKHRPKQLLKLTSPDETMLGESVSRLAPLIAPEHVYVVTGEHLVEPIREAGVGLPEGNVIAEPAKRNTAGALAYAAAHAMAKYNDDGSRLAMAVVTADHLIGNPARFRATVETALEQAETRDALVTLGIVPARPETGYGYIRAVAPLDEGADIPAYEVAEFLEKPDEERARQFVESGSYYWNSGMFFWKISAFLAELEHARPHLAEATRTMADAMAKGDDALVRRTFDALEDISIDYALMEQAREVIMVRADFPWDDVGAWTALDRTQPKDEQGNVAAGDPVLADTRNSIVFNDAGAGKMAVGVVGMDDVIVVATEDAVLVMPKDRAQDVRKVVQALKERQAPQR